MPLSRSGLPDRCFQKISSPIKAPPSADSGRRSIPARGRCSNKSDFGDKNKPTRKHIRQSRFHRVPRARSPVPKFRVPRAQKICTSRGFAGFQLCRKSDIVPTVFGSSAWRCVPPLSSARIHNVANIQADADLHTVQTHHRDAVHDMRGADAARTDRATRPQLQFADL
jgi:hypothetical protein